MIASAGSKRPYLLSEVVQTSNMDCGPAALTSFLCGLGVPVSYARLRDACQTDVDGTSIDTIEQVALDLGVDVEQVMLPKEHLLPEGQGELPAILVLQLPDGSAHFAVAWRRHGSHIQVMDPASGRRWPTIEEFKKELFIHRMSVPAAHWREWAGSDDFLRPLRARIEGLGLGEGSQDLLLNAALEDTGWNGLGRLDASVRLLEELVQSSALTRGEDSEAALINLTQDSAVDDSLSERFWSVRACPDDPHALIMQGAVLIRLAEATSSDVKAPISRDLVRALEVDEPRPYRYLIGLMRNTGLVPILVCLLAIIAGSAAVAVEALIFRAFLDIQGLLSTPAQRLSAVAIIGSFVLLQLMLERGVKMSAARLGRQLENRFRVRFFEVLREIPDRYFFSRPSSDTTHRSHSLHYLREMPLLVAECLQSGMQILATVIAVAWLVPELAPFLLSLALVLIGLPVIFQSILSERDYRARTHDGAISRYYLDALVGLVPIRAHGAEHAMRFSHESMLVRWVSASRDLLGWQIVSEALIWYIGLGASVAIVMYVSLVEGHEGVLLLIVYWMMTLPMLANTLARCILQFPFLRNIVKRALEPFDSANPDGLTNTEQDVLSSELQQSSGSGSPEAITVSEVSLAVSGQTILSDLNLEFRPAEHVAVVGASGAGKSSLVGLILGWHKPQQGSVSIGGRVLETEELARLRNEVAWVDPAVHLWNRSLCENLDYGANGDLSLAKRLSMANLLDLLAGLKDGLRTHLGESGALVSGGEGQRIRYSRALGRNRARYVVLDEAFRGLGRDDRHSLMTRSRELWRESTLFFVSHDVSDTVDFDRVLVLRDGRVVEDGSPADLRADRESEYSKLLDDEADVRKVLGDDSLWRKLSMTNGKLQDELGD